MTHPPANQFVRLTTAAKLVSRSPASLNKAIKSGRLTGHYTADRLLLVLPADAEHWAATAKRGRPKRA